MFNLKILDYYNITVHSLVSNKLSESIMHGATIRRTNLVSPVFVGMFYDVSFDTSRHTTGTADKSSPFTCVPNVMYRLRKY